MLNGNQGDSFTKGPVDVTGVRYESLPSCLGRGCSCTKSWVAVKEKSLEKQPMLNLEGETLRFH